MKPIKKNTQKQYDLVFDQSQSVFEKKAEEYGTSWRKYRPLSAMYKIQIKAERIRTLQETGVQKVSGAGNGIPDEFAAILNYSIIAVINLENPGTDRIEMKKLMVLYKKHRKAITILMQKKNHDYGEAWRRAPMAFLVDEILTKLARVRAILSDPKVNPISEGIEANYQDIANYAIFALILISEGNDPMI